MKLLPHFLLFVAAVLMLPDGLLMHRQSSCWKVLAFQFHRHRGGGINNRRIRRDTSSLYYKEPSPPPEDITTSSGDNNNNNFNVWSVLANTERWISDTLDKSNSAEVARRQQPPPPQQQKKENKLHFADEKKAVVPPVPSNNNNNNNDNPYARKEISYVCETNTDLVSVVGGIFRRVREARELGERHGRKVMIEITEQQQATGDSLSLPTTMRQTNVVVIPNCLELNASFHTFDTLVMAINQARRAARDFVLKKKEERTATTKEDDWVVAINCAHLHPQYGMPTPDQQLAALQHEDSEGEVDVNLQEYKQRRDEARRSPYPSVIVEVLSTPPADFGSRLNRRRNTEEEEEEVEAAATASRMQEDAAAARARKDVVDSDVTSEDVKRLEALFAMSAATKESPRNSIDDPFYDALGEAFGNKQIISQTPLSMAQNWVLQNDPSFHEETSTFTTSNTRHVDAAYEFVFVNLAMLNAEEGGADGSTTTATAAGDDTTTTTNTSTNTNSSIMKSKRGQMSYVVLPNFVPTSATSFDRFAGQVSNIIRAIPSLVEKVTISTYHPEHVEKSTRSPVPIVVITWK